MRLIGCWLAAVCGFASLVGCSGAINRFTVNSTAPVLKIGSAAIDSESDLQFAREALPGSIKTVESFAIVTPDNRDLLEILAQGYTQYPFAFLEDDLEALGENGDAAAKDKLVARCSDFYDRALVFAKRLAGLDSSGLAVALEGSSEDLDKVLRRDFTSSDSAVGLFWTGMALGSKINLHRDDMNLVADLPKATALLERAHTLAPLYYNHGAAMTLGVVYAAQGKAMGGDPARAKLMFDEVISATGGKFLMARVLYARFYATVVQDRALFEKTLHEVLDAPATIWPEQRLANEVAKKRAARYLTMAEDLFLPPEPSTDAGKGGQ